MVNKRRLLINVCNKRYATAIFRLLCSCRCDCGRALNLVPRGENQVKIPRTGMYKINTPFGANKKYVGHILNYLRHISNYVGHIFYPFQTRMKTKVSPTDKYGHADLVCRGCANHGNSSCRVMPPTPVRLVRPCAFVRYLCKNMKVFEKLSYFSICLYICNINNTAYD